MMNTITLKILEQNLFISAVLIQSTELLHEQSSSHDLSACRIKTLILCFMLFVDLGHVHVYYWYEKVQGRVSDIPDAGRDLTGVKEM